MLQSKVLFLCAPNKNLLKDVKIFEVVVIYIYLIIRQLSYMQSFN